MEVIKFTPPMELDTSTFIDSEVMLEVAEDMERMTDQSEVLDQAAEEARAAFDERDQSETIERFADILETANMVCDQYGEIAKASRWLSKAAKLATREIQIRLALDEFKGSNGG